MLYVSDEAIEKAKEMAKKFQFLRPEAGVIFVGVKAHPAEEGRCKTFEVHLGVMRQIGESTGRSLVRYVLLDEIDRGTTIIANVFSGICGAAHDSGHAEVDSPPA